MEYNEVLVIDHALLQKRIDYLIFAGVGEFIHRWLSVYYRQCVRMCDRHGGLWPSWTTCLAILAE